MYVIQSLAELMVPIFIHYMMQFLTRLIYQGSKIFMT